MTLPPAGIEPGDNETPGQCEEMGRSRSTEPTSAYTDVPPKGWHTVPVADCRQGRCSLL